VHRTEEREVFGIIVVRLAHQPVERWMLRAS
jgi:hypothetical protein